MRPAIKKEKQNQDKRLNSVDGVISYSSIQQNKTISVEKTNRERLFSLGKIYDKNRKNKAIEMGRVKISTSVKAVAYLIGKVIGFFKLIFKSVSGGIKQFVKIIYGIVRKVAKAIAKNKILKNTFKFLTHIFGKVWGNKVVSMVVKKISVVTRLLQGKLKKLGLLKFFSAFRQLAQKANFRRSHLQMIILATVILAITGFVFFRETKVGAYTYAWVQTEWDAAATPNSTTSHLASQNGRTDNTAYQAKDANIQINNPDAPGSQVTLSTVNGTPWTEASSSDFNAGAQSNTYVNGNSVSLQKNNGVACGGNIECSAGNCGTDFSSGQYCHATASSCVDFALGSPWEQVNGYVKCSGTSYSKACSNGVWGAQVNNPNPTNSYCDAGGGAQTGYDLAATCNSGVGGGFSNSCQSCNYYMAASTSSCKTSCTADSDCWPGGAYGCVSNACVVIDPCQGVTSVTQGTLTYNTVKVYTGSNGQCWLDRNLGATEVASSSADTNAYGWYFQWGRLADGHQLPNSGTTTTVSSTDNPGNSNFIYGNFDWRSPQNDNLWGAANGYINNPCPTGWHVPTQSEWSSAVSGLGITNSATALSSVLKLPTAGDRSYGNASFLDPGVGFYWASSTNSNYANSLEIYSSGVSVGSNYYAYRAEGLSVRCLKN
jgi:uncharacterized protein (TIGR02145 family)